MADVARSLNKIIADLQKAQDRVLKAARTTLEEACKCGELLNEAKEQVPHGEWEVWLERNFHGSKTVAQNYMRIAQNWDQIEEIEQGKNASNAFLSVTDAVKKLANPKKQSSQSTGSKQDTSTSGSSGSDTTGGYTEEGSGSQDQSQSGDTETGEESGDDGGEPEDPMAPAWEAAQEWKSIASQLTRYLKSLKEQQQEWYAAHLRDEIGSLTTHLNGAAACLRRAAPYALCHDCQGESDDCETCSGLGFLNREEYKRETRDAEAANK